MRLVSLVPIAFLVLACSSSEGESAGSAPSSTAGAAGAAGSSAGGGGSSAGAGGSAGKGGWGDPFPVCIAGKQETCACPGGAMGAQACKGDGSGFEACVCPSGQGGGGAGGSVAGAGGGGQGGAGAGGASAGQGGGAGAAGVAGKAGAGGSPSPKDAPHETCESWTAAHPFSPAKTPCDAQHTECFVFAMSKQQVIDSAWLLDGACVNPNEVNAGTGPHTVMCCRPESQW